MSVRYFATFLYNFKNRIFFILLALTAFLVLGDHVISPDEGLVLNAAWQLWQGKTIYADFVQYISPGAGYATFLAWMLTGSPTYLVAKMLAIILWLTSAWGIILIGKELKMPRPAVWLSLAFWLAACRVHPVINHNSYSSYLSVWPLYFLITAREKGLYRHKIKAAGLAAGTVFLFLQTKGLAIAGLTSAYLFFFNGHRSERILRTAVFLANFILITSIPFLFFGPRLVFESLFIFPGRAGYMDHTYIVPLYIFFEIFVVLSLALYAYYKSSGKWLMLAVYQAALFLSSLNLIDITHFLINSFPFWLFFSLVIIRILDKMKAQGFMYYFLLATFIAPVICILILMADYFLPESLLKNNLITVDLFKKRQAGYFLEIPQLKKAQIIYSGPFYPGVAFEMKLENPFRYDNMFLCSADCQQETLQVFREKQPDYAFLNYSLVDVLKYDPDNAIDNHIRKNYNYCSKISKSNFSIYSREECPEFIPTK